MMVIPFSQALRERTQTAHSDTEGSSFIGDLLSGKRPKQDYVALVQQQYSIYQALESVAEKMKDDPRVAQFVSPKLTRLPAIEADLTFLTGPDWAEQIEPLLATRRYVQRIHETESWPGGYIAHHYTRYLGDLSGGQIIRTLLQGQFGFETNGVGFYIFGEIASPKRFKDTYRAQLDEVDWDDAERDRVIKEVCRAYRYNADLFADLAEATRRAVA